MYSQLLSRRCQDQLEGEALEYLTYVEQGTRRMDVLLQDLLAYSRVVHNDHQATTCDLSAVITEAIRELRRGDRGSTRGDLCWTYAGFTSSSGTDGAGVSEPDLECSEVSRTGAPLHYHLRGGAGYRVALYSRG